MKRIILILVILTIFSSCKAIDKQPTDIGKKYLKLAYTYLLAKDCEWAAYYLEKSAIYLDRNDKYWLAAIYEGYGYLNQCKSNDYEAVRFFKKAYRVYRKYVIDPEDSRVQIRKSLAEDYGIGLYSFNTAKKLETLKQIIEGYKQNHCKRCNNHHYLNTGCDFQHKDYKYRIEGKHYLGEDLLGDFDDEPLFEQD